MKAKERDVSRDTPEKREGKVVEEELHGKDG